MGNEKIEETISKLAQQIKMDEGDLDVLYTHNKTGTVVARVLQRWDYFAYFCIGDQTGYAISRSYYTGNSSVEVGAIKEDLEKISVPLQGWTCPYHFNIESPVADLIIDKSKLTPYGTKCEPASIWR